MVLPRRPVQRSLRTTAACALSLALVPSGVLAQTAGRPRGPRARGVAGASAAPESGVLVTGRPRTRELSRRELTAEEVRTIPGARGDALLAVLNLPGVSRPQFGLGQFVLRSAPPEDSLVLLEGHPIALPFHLYGLASTIATDLIDRVEVLPGNFSARYGRVGGGVIHVSLRAPPRDRARASLDVDVIDAGAFVSVPITSRASIAVGARGSFLSLLAPVVIPPESSSFRQWPRYGDWQIALDWDPSERHAIRVVGSGTDDAFVSQLAQPDPNDPALRGEVSSRVAYHGLQAQWRARLAPGWTHTFSPAVAYQLQDARLGPAVRYRFEAVTLSLRDELEARIDRRTRVSVGLDAQAVVSDDQVRAPPVSSAGLSDPITPATLVTYRAVRTAFNPAGYLELESEPAPSFRVQAGVRAEHFSSARATVADPRVSARWSVAPRLAVRAAVGGYASPPKGYTSLPGFGNPALRPERWTHASAAFEWLPRPGIELDVGAFAKTGAQLVAPSDRWIVRDGQTTPERFSNEGVGRVLGLELQARARPSRLPVFVLISYTLQRAERAACAGCPMRTYTFDQPHNLSASVGAALPRGFELGARFRATSGLVEPVVRGALYDADGDVSLTLVDDGRVGRLPPFVSLDLRAAWRFTARSIRGQLVLEILNATNERNVESRVYSFDRRASAAVLGLPILPSLGFSLAY
jgi:outer membrane receptor protein involved in Fe transport